MGIAVKQMQDAVLPDDGDEVPPPTLHHRGEEGTGLGQIPIVQVVRNSLVVPLQLARVERRVYEHYEIPFTYDEGVLSLIAERCTEVESGGRMIDAILTNNLLPAVSQECLIRKIDGRPITRVHVGVADDEFSFAFD